MGQAATHTRVLLVEDEPLISGLMTETLEEAGFVVHAVTNGQAALDHLAGGNRVDILFTDIMLAGSMNGAELAARVRATRPELPIIYASGFCGPGEMAAMVPRSVFVPKPYSPHEVCTLLSRMAPAH